MLEDESGRIALVGERIRSARLVTGVVLGILGIETSGGEFEVVDICTAGMAPQPYSDLTWGESSAGSSQEGKAEKMDVDGMCVSSNSYCLYLTQKLCVETPVPGQEQDEWVAILSGLEISSTSPADAQIQMLAEYLTGEAGGLDDQASAARISRLIVAGNSLAHILNADGTVPEEKMERKGVRILTCYILFLVAVLHTKMYICIDTPNSDVTAKTLPISRLILRKHSPPILQISRVPCPSTFFQARRIPPAPSCLNNPSRVRCLAVLLRSRVSHVRRTRHTSVSALLPTQRAPPTARRANKKHPRLPSTVHRR